MAKFLIQASYKVDGVKGLLKEGGSSRRAAVEQMIHGLGGRMEAFYFAFGGPDAFVIMDVPDTATAAAVSLKINSTGTEEVSTVALITPDEIDAACKKTVRYRAPGG